MLTKTGIEKYFIAEKQESLLFMMIAAAAIVTAFVFFFGFRSSFFKGLAVPLVLIGILQAVVGYTVYSRSDRQRIDTIYAFDMNPAKLKNEEFPRMVVVMKNFVVYRYVEISLAFLGICLFFFFRTNPERMFWCGFGLALMIQALLMLVADYFAESRGREYIEALKMLFIE